MDNFKEEDISDISEKYNAIKKNIKVENINKKEWLSNKIVFYDLETTFPDKTTGKRDIIEFGSITLDKFTLVEEEEFSTLIYSDKVTNMSKRFNGITENKLVSAPLFKEVAKKIYSILNGNVWAGHNIINFDNNEIFKTFLRHNLEPPLPCGIIDTYLLMKKMRFFEYTENLKLSTLTLLYGLGEEKHRSLDDCNHNIQVFLKFSTFSLLQREYNQSIKEKKNNPISEPITTQTTSSQSDLIKDDHCKTNKDVISTEMNNYIKETQRIISVSRLTTTLEDHSKIKRYDIKPETEEAVQKKFEKKVNPTKKKIIQQKVNDLMNNPKKNINVNIKYNKLIRVGRLISFIDEQTIEFYDIQTQAFIKLTIDKISKIWDENEA